MQAVSVEALATTEHPPWTVAVAISDENQNRENCSEEVQRSTVKGVCITLLPIGGIGQQQTILTAHSSLVLVEWTKQVYEPESLHEDSKLGKPVILRLLLIFLICTLVLFRGAESLACYMQIRKQVRACRRVLQRVGLGDGISFSGRSLCSQVFGSEWSLPRCSKCALRFACVLPEPF